MKKKVLIMFLTSCMIASMTGCEVKENDRKDETSQSQETSGLETIETTNLKESEDQVTKGEVIDHFEYDGVIYGVDENGYIADIIELSDLANEEFLTQEQKDILSEAQYCGMDGNRVIYAYRDYREGYPSKLISLDLDQKKYEEIFATETCCISYTQVYQDKVYMDLYEYDNPSEEMEYVFSYDESGYFEEEAPLKDIIGQYSGFQNKLEPYTKTMGECGYLVIEKEGAYAMVDENGNETLLDLEPDSYVSTYSKSFIFYYTSEEGISKDYIYDISSKQSYELCEDYYDLYIFDDQIFLLKDESDEFGVSKIHLYTYIPSVGLDKEVYACQDVPGLLTTSGASGFTYVNGNIYYLKEENDGAKWYMSKCTDDGYSSECLDVVYEKSPFADFGIVTYASHTDICKDCGYEFGKIYVETPELSLDQPGVGAINEALATYSKEVYDTLLNNVYEYGMDEEQVHEQDLGAYVNDLRISKVEILSDKYVTVEFSGMEENVNDSFWGRLEVKQLAFDLETGEKIDILSLYSGSEEELRDLIAKKAVEDLTTIYEEDEFDSVENAEEIYEMVYEKSLDSGEIFLEKDGIVVYLHGDEIGYNTSDYCTFEISYDALSISL